MALMSKRARLRQLVVLHPDWTYKQYADHLGQSIGSIRGALSKMRMSRNKPVVKKEKPVREKTKRPVPEKSKVTVYSYSGPSRFGGYIKLI